MSAVSYAGHTRYPKMTIDRASFRFLYDLGCAFAARRDLDGLVPLVVEKCREVFEAEGASVLLLDEETRELYFPYVAGENPEITEQLRQLRFPADQGIAGAVIESGEPVRSDDAATDARFYAGIDRNIGRTTRALIAAPLRSFQGLIGVIEVVNRRDGGTFSDDDLGFLQALAGSVSIALENARLWERLQESNDHLRAQVTAYRRDTARRDRFGTLLSNSAAMTEPFQLMESAASTSITVLIEGESGTGKELAARGIHGAGARADGPFVAVNCAALSESLLERELFGHKKGAFTGAIQDERGLFEAAHGGTIFLDEVGEMPPAMQAKLLRVLQEGEITPVGDTRPRKVDVRVIAATNRSLAMEAKEGRFREDLFYRLAMFPVTLPPLRQRRDDIPLLAEHFRRVATVKHGRTVATIDPAALGLLVAFDWPGNVRELQNEIERAVVLAVEGGRVAPQHLSLKIRMAATTGDDVPAIPITDASPTSDLREARQAFEIHHLKTVLRDHENNISRTARALGISRVALQKKMKELGLR